MSRRRLGVALLLVVAACSGDDGLDTAAPTTTSTPPSTTAAVECTGIGAMTGREDITFVRDGHVWTDDGRCIADAEDSSRLSWGGNADRLLVGERTVLLVDGPSGVVGHDLEALTWSLPTGTAIVVQNAEEELSKVSLVGDPPISLAGLPLGLRDVTYHPSGTAIAGIEDIGPNVILASNRGEDPRWLLANEPADEVTDIAFSADGDLLFVARHDDEWHLHHLVLGDVEVSDVLVADEPIGDITASPLDEDAWAASRGTCDQPGDLYVEVDGEVRDLSGTVVEHARPIGWTSGTGLVVLTCDGDLYLVTTSTPTLVAEGVTSAAVRVVHPPPPAPPPEIDAAPA